MSITTHRFTRALQTALWSRTTIAAFKSLLAYVIFFVLFFLDSFDALFSLPAAGTSAVLLCIAGFPGKSIGACFQGVFSALMGVALGAFNFYVLAQLAPWPVAQACTFFVMVYLLGLLKASDPKWFAFSLLCILMSWNGISTTVNAPGRQFSSGSLTSYFTAYLWGGAIVLFVNILVFPHSAEKELRMTLVASLDHCRTFVCLLSKTYRLEISEEEIRVRDGLAQSIRADFSILQGKMADTAIEISWSKWSMSDYHSMVQRTRAMQQILTTVHTNLKSLEALNVQNFRRDFLSSRHHEIDALNKAIYRALTDLQKELAVGKQWDSLNQNETEALKDFDPEQNSSRTSGINRPRSTSRSESTLEAENRLRTVQRQLENELSMGSRDSSSIETLAPTPSVIESGEDGQTANPKHPANMTSQFKKTESPIHSTSVSTVGRLKRACAMFEESQYRNIGEYLASDQLYHPNEPMILEAVSDSPSDPESTSSMDIQEVTNVSEDQAQNNAKLNSLYVPLPQPQSKHPTTMRLAIPGNEAQKISSTTLTRAEESETQQAFIRAFSYTFSLHNLVNETIELLELVTVAGLQRKKSLHFHLLEKRIPVRGSGRVGLSAEEAGEKAKQTSSDGEEDENSNLSMQKALDALEGRKHIPVKTSLLGRLILLEEYLRGPDSICAFKAACGVIVLGVLFWANNTRYFATNFSLTGGLITVVVAITPTLGQSWMSFIFQIFGQGLGLIYAMIALLIFKDVGGYRYNPYGLVAALVVFAAPLCFVLYDSPQLFVFCLLALNSAGVLTYTEFLNRNRTFDEPPLRMAKSLTVLAIALGVVACFQLLILRNPAKRTLRKATAQVMKANTAYTIILQAYVRATITTDPTRRPSPEALQRVFRDLIKRESQIQTQIVGLMPLMKFASAEPSFVKPFNAAQYLRLIRANQLILDRNRDARMAVGNAPLPEFLMKEFVEKITPHRERALPHVRVSLYLCTSTLQSKFPLPERLPLSEEYTSALFHDALVLSMRLSKSPQGLGFANSRELTRYWSYLLSMTSICHQLEEIEEATQVLFGKMEDDPLNY